MFLYLLIHTIKVIYFNNLVNIKTTVRCLLGGQVINPCHQNLVASQYLAEKILAVIAVEKQCSCTN
jgi:hypothetical protein